VLGLKALHELKIMHRDLKSANIFLSTSGHVKIGNMNVSKVSDRYGMNYTQTGTPFYASPEVWKTNRTAPRAIYGLLAVSCMKPSLGKYLSSPQIWTFFTNKFLKGPTSEYQTILLMT